MAAMNAAEQRLSMAIQRKDAFVELQIHGRANAFISKTFEDDPRLGAFVCGYEGGAQQKARGMMGMLAGTTYNLRLNYHKDAPASIEDVIVDDGAWLPSAYARTLGDMPDRVVLVTQDVNALLRRAENDLKQLCDLVPGIRGLKHNSYDSFAKAWKVVWMTFDYGMSLQKYRQFCEAAEQRALMLLPRFGDGTVPKFVKIFLAFSYLQIMCSYDEATSNLIKDGRQAEVRNPGSMVAYGPLVQNMGICTGFAEAFRMLMDRIGVECRLISGRLGDVDAGREHQWDLVQLGGRWYHVDACFGVDSPDVCAQKFMKTDAEMASTHFWDRSGDYPKASGSYYTVDYICDYIEDNEAELLAAGADRRFLLPTLNL